MSDRIVIIGGGGFIGSAVAENLARRGRRVTVLSRAGEPTSRIAHLIKTLPEMVRYVSGDGGDEDVLRDCTEGHSHLILLAYTWSIGMFPASGVDELTENLKLAESVFSVAASSGKRLVLVSSGGTVYGEAMSSQIPEVHQTNPVSRYGFTKLMIELYADYYSRTKGLEYICLRPSNAYGEGQIPFRGQGFVATAVASIIQGRPVEIYGEEGTIRDYLYISDLVEAIVLSLLIPSTGNTYNVGTGRGYSNGQILHELDPIVRCAGLSVKTKILPARQRDVARNVLDSKKFELETGWVPEVSLKEGLKMTFRWQSETNIRNEKTMTDGKAK